jgi:hypothetical protein
MEFHEGLQPPDSLLSMDSDSFRSLHTDHRDISAEVVDLGMLCGTT